MKALRFASALAAAVLLQTATALAQGSTANALEEWGLIGTWSVRCDLAPAGNNSHYRFIVDLEGRAWQERDFGNPSQNDRSEILSAQRRPDGTLALMVNFTSFNQIRLNVYAKSESRVRVVYNRGPTGDVTVENGVLRHNGQPTPWSGKCR